MELTWIAFNLKKIPILNLGSIPLILLSLVGNDLAWMWIKLFTFEKIKKQLLFSATELPDFLLWFNYKFLKIFWSIKLKINSNSFCFWQ